MQEEQKKELYAMIERAFKLADWFEDDGGKVIIIIPKTLGPGDITRQVKVTVIREEISRI